MKRYPHICFLSLFTLEEVFSWEKLMIWLGIMLNFAGMNLQSLKTLKLSIAMKAISFLFIAMLISFSQVSAQDSNESAAVNGPEITFDKTVHDYGEIFVGSDGSSVFACQGPHVDVPCLPGQGNQFCPASRIVLP